FPVIIVAGAALLGYLAGEMLVSDPVDAAWFEVHVPHAHLVFGAVGAILVVVIGKLMQKRGARTA
ncbi:TerC family protein, partial [Salmonella enterica]|nr:TerC family protein [Salmonella enterica]